MDIETRENKHTAVGLPIRAEALPPERQYHNPRNSKTGLYWSTGFHAAGTEDRVKFNIWGSDEDQTPGFLAGAGTLWHHHYTCES